LQIRRPQDFHAKDRGERARARQHRNLMVARVPAGWPD
jgi:hypothetical protein